MRKPVAIAVSVVAAGCLVPLLVDRTPPESAAPVVAEVPGPSDPIRVRPVEVRSWEGTVRPVEAAVVHPLAHRFVEGDRRLYRVRHDQETRLDLDLSKLGAGEGTRTSEHRQEIDGRLEFLVYSTRPGEHLLGVRVETLALRLGADAPVALEEACAEELEFLIRIDDAGRILAYLFPPAIEAGASALFKGLLGSFQVALPAGAKEEWEATERDSTGTYLARYRRSDHVDGAGARLARVEKSFRGYESVASGRRDVLAGALYDAVAWFDLEAGWVRSMDFENRVLVTDPEMTATSGARSSGLVLLLEAGRDGRSDAARGRRLDALLASGRWSGADAGAELAQLAREDREAALDARLARTSFEELLDRLVLRESGKISAEEGSEAFRTLVHWLRRDPSSIGRMRDLIGSAGLDRGVRGALLGALASAGTPAAESALVEIAGDRSLPEGTRASAASALGQSGPATPATVESLRRIVLGAEDGDLAEAAQLSLGSLAPRAGAQGAAEIAGFLEQRLAGADGEERLEVLAAMGNAGRPENAASILASLASDDDAERRAAL